ncbi:MAG: hypothetical protein KY464_16885 [Gemmatimonadetes bacterium]|nr:hypothetical protein [Gemmatimonadota bacterium]
MKMPRVTLRGAAIGVALAEVGLIVGLAIVVMLAAVVTPAVTATIDRQRVDQGARTLAELAAGFPPFYNHTTANPGRLSQLTGPISVGQLNSCGIKFSGSAVSKWAGPYYNARVIAVDGALPVFVGHARDVLVRVPPNQNAGSLGIVVDGVREEDVRELDRQVDGSGGASSGTIQWGNPDAEGLYTITYYTPVTGC